uniref:Helix-turn-helix domain-containing protein n=1 Tax=candidate division WOR-3 bacterium TaxID=2052148 RepID=A0A7C6E9B4_UNCW3
MNIIELNKRIAKAIEYSGLKQKEIAEKVGLTTSEMSNIVKGVVKNPKLKVLVELAKICKVDLRWLITGEGEMIKQEPIKYGAEDLVMVPIYGRIPAGKLTHIEEIYEGQIPVLKKDVPPEAFALKVIGNSMAPELEESDIVVIVPTQLENLKGKGEIVALRIHTDTTIKCLHILKDKIILSSINRAYPPIVVTPDEIDAIFKVILKIKKYKE